ncbi:MAG TPA: hypothetical protein VFB04_14060 [Terriglobales bacterium]|nr:hypothetical protein [Terriglobales bacterium]
MHLHQLDYVLWFTTPLLQIAVLIAMFRRGLHRSYPYFFNYTIIGILSVPILYVLYRQSYTVYYYAYYTNIGLSVIVSFAVLQEIFKDAFRPYEALRELSVILFRWSALVVLLVAVMWAINTGKSNHGVVTDIIMLADRALRLMQCGLVFFLLLFSEYLGIPRRSLLFGISLGFGFFASVNMLVFTGFAHHGFLKQATLSTINSGAYMFAVVLWLGYTLAAAPARSKVTEDLLERSRDWNSALEDARVPVVADSLLDSMDQTVERLLYPQEDAKVKI